MDATTIILFIVIMGVTMAVWCLVASYVGFTDADLKDADAGK